MTSEEGSEAPESGFIAPTDPRAIRALAHPVRMRLIELLAHTGTVTATQASEVLGESPANCAFHLRTLAKYGYVEEAGGGHGRERPWRRTHSGLQFSDQEDAAYTTAVDALAEFALGQLFDRARTGLAGRANWPAGWSGQLGMNQTLMYLTPDEATELGRELFELLMRYSDRIDHPDRRPPDALPVEVVALGYPLMHLLDVPVPGTQTTDQPDTGER
jgi:DNA-binding transcriptional ArsR family regulator